jgi:V/A-type H+-transporting ATPase subunit I
MQKITIFVRSSWKDEVLNTLRKMGILHLRPMSPPESERLEEVRENILVMERSISLIPGVSHAETYPDPEYEEDGFALARQLLAFTEEMKHLEEEIKRLEEEYNRVRVWGRFDPEEINMLEERGITVRFFQVDQKGFRSLIKGQTVHIISRKGPAFFIAVFSTEDSADIPFHEVEIPTRGLAKIEALIEKKREGLLDTKEKISEISGKAYHIKNTLMRLKSIFGYETAKAGMHEEGDISYIVGFCPASEVINIRKTAEEKQWGLQIEDPSDSDPVPTLIKYSKMSKLFRPVMEFVGVVPGYREYDTNAFFLMFFSIFFALLIGDAGYGIVILLMTLLAWKYLKHAPRETMLLLCILSMTTILWGTITGVWFGVKEISQLPVLRNMIIPSLYGYTEKNEETVIRICFLIGAFQLSIAHIWAAIRTYPSLAAFAEIGWAVFVWGIYWIVGFLVLNDEMYALKWSLPVIGMSMVVLFEKQNNNGIFKGFSRGFAELPINTLTGIGSLSDLVSYVRLFAVGLATKEVAMAFNGMANDVGFDSVVGILLSVFILLFGHTANLMLAAMAILVHGVRLNLLEFSRHLNIEWSGIPFKPFKIVGG